MARKRNDFYSTDSGNTRGNRGQSADDFGSSLGSLQKWHGADYDWPNSGLGSSKGNTSGLRGFGNNNGLGKTTARWDRGDGGRNQASPGDNDGGLGGSWPKGPKRGVGPYSGNDYGLGKPQKPGRP